MAFSPLKHWSQDQNSKTAIYKHVKNGLIFYFYLFIHAFMSCNFFCHPVFLAQLKGLHTERIQVNFYVFGISPAVRDHYF